MRNETGMGFIAGLFLGALISIAVATLVVRNEIKKHTNATPCGTVKSEPARLTMEQSYALLRMGKYDTYVPVKVVHFNEMTKKVLVVVDSMGYSSFRKLDLKDIKIPQ